MGFLSDSGFVANVNRLQDFILSLGPSAYYVCKDGGATLEDLSGNGLTLTLSGVATSNASALVPADPNGFYLGLAAGANIYQRVNPFAAPLVGDWTFVCAFAPLNYGTNTINIFTIGGNGETEVLNYQFDFRVITPTGELQQFWEHGAGVNDVIASGISLDEGEASLLACVKDGTANTVTFYKNGIKLAVVAYANEPTGGTDPTVQMGVGDAGTGAVSGQFLLGHAAFFNGVKLTELQIAEIARLSGFLGPP